MLLKSRRDVSDACKKCDVPGSFKGIEQANQWKELWTV